MWPGAGGRALPDQPPRSVDDPTGADFIATTERDEDPLGIDVTTGRKLDQAAEALARQRRARAAHPDLPRERGQVVSGIRPVREIAHEVSVRWAHGLQYVSETITLESGSRFAAEAAYRLALPEGARVLALRLCARDRCRDAQALDDRAQEPAERDYVQRLTREQEAQAPACFAQQTRDARSEALAIRVAPLTAKQPVRVEVQYAVARPVRGGVVRLKLPPRGRDPRAAPARIDIEADALTLPALPDNFTLDPWMPLELAATYAPSRTGTSSHRMRARCGKRTCERHWSAAPLGPAQPVELWVLIDGSPSMEGPARSRVQAALAALLRSVPAGSLVRLGAFAATARELSTEALPPDALPIDRVAQALRDRTEARTRLSSGLALALTRWRGHAERPPRLVVLTDARFSLSDTAQRAAARWRREGIPSFVIQLADTAPNTPRREWIHAAGMSLVEVAPEAKRAVRRHDPEPLTERLAHIVHDKPRVSPTPGEQVVRRAHSHARARGASLAERHWLTPHPPRAFLASLQAAEAGLAPRGTPLYPAEPYESAQHNAPPRQDSAMPSTSVLKMLRDQLLPKARACLRRDRAGRADYAVHATFHFLLERQEILEARIEGQLERPLRDCLDAILASLRIPWFSGRVRVRYPIYTQREPLPPTIELAPETARQLDRLFERERPTP